MSEADNYRRWTDATRGAYEVWYMTWNHPGTDQGYWLRFITEAPISGPPRAELWFARFDPKHPERTFGVHRVFPGVTASESPFRIQLPRARLGHDHSQGHLEGDGHQISWDLRWEPAPRTLRFLPDIMYARGGLGETTVHSPNPRVPLSGTLVVDGEQLTFDRAVAGQTHVWGKKHAFSWVWGRCAEFAGAPDALLEILAVKLQRRGVTLPRMTLVNLELDGERHYLNQYRHVLSNRASWRTGHVAFTAWSPTVKIEGEMRCTPDQLVTAPYEDPDGTRVYCANTEIGDASVTVFRRRGLGWREHRRLEAHRRAHFETGAREPDPAVVRQHVRVE
ncbi:MAG: tocopherol cyclase family protein [Kofleriaceae bacterium]